MPETVTAPQVTVAAPYADEGPDDGAAPPDDDRSGLGDRLPALRPLSPVPTYVGIAVAALGFVVIAFAWGKVAGITESVALQLPYLLSGGLVGLALVMTGLTVVSVAARRRDAVLREQQTQLLADALRELRTALDPRQR